MPALLTTASTLMCPHGGTITGTPGATRAKAGAVILRANDTFTIKGCTFNVSSVPQPCTSVQWVAAAQKVSHAGAHVLTEASVGLCIGPVSPVPQGTVIIAATQQKVAGL